MVSLSFPHRPLQRLPAGGFRSALGRGTDWHKAMTECLDQLGEVGPATLGMVYMTGPLAAQAGPITAGLRTATGINDWVGSSAVGLVDPSLDPSRDASLSIMVGRFPENAVRLFGMGGRGRTAWVRRQRPNLALVHGASGRGDISQSLRRLHKATTADLIGGIPSDPSGGGGPHGGNGPHGGGPHADGGGGTLQIGERLSEQGLSGVLFAESVQAISGLTQGCMPISPAREITEARGQFVLAIDGQPALSVLKRDVGEVLARDIRRAEGYIFAGITDGGRSGPPAAGAPAKPPPARPPHAGREEAAYLIRQIVAADEESGAVVLSQPVTRGQGILFARRDKESARADLRGMLHRLEARLGGRLPKGALYVTARTRGATLFDDGLGEVSEIRRVFGDVPLTGFLSDGEFYDSRCYGYAGVLTLFY